MNIKDRGNKKWTAMMLIEHRKKLKELKEHEDDRKKPILDDQEKAVINSRLHQALERNLKVKIKYYRDKRFKTISGRIKRVDVNRKEVVISDEVIDVEDLLELKIV
jgi:hypothetical protein